MWLISHPSPSSVSEGTAHTDSEADRLAPMATEIFAASQTNAPQTFVEWIT